jgi:hypothetical protein
MERLDKPMIKAVGFIVKDIEKQKQIPDSFLLGDVEGKISLIEKGKEK